MCIVSCLHSFPFLEKHVNDPGASIPFIPQVISKLLTLFPASASGIELQSEHSQIEMLYSCQ